MFTEPSGEGMSSTGVPSSEVHQGDNEINQRAYL